VLHGVADGFVGKLPEKVSSITIVLRKYQASEMPSSINAIIMSYYIWYWVIFDGRTAVWPSFLLARIAFC